MSAQEPRPCSTELLLPDPISIDIDRTFRINGEIGIPGCLSKPYKESDKPTENYAISTTQGPNRPHVTLDDEGDCVRLCLGNRVGCTGSISNLHRLGTQADQNAHCLEGLRRSRSLPDVYSPCLMRQHKSESLITQPDQHRTRPCSRIMKSSFTLSGSILNPVKPAQIEVTSITSMTSSAGTKEQPQILCPSSPVCPAVSIQAPDRCNVGPATTVSSGTSTTNVEAWGWSESLNNWNPNQLKLLKQSWRASTRKTYDLAWKKWVTWATNQKIDFKKPSGSDVAKYLSDLHLVHKLSYRTILVYKSVVSTLCNTEVSGQLSSHVLVKQVLKSIALQKPASSVKPPIWNTETLVNHLTSCKVNLESTFQSSRHTAILLLLCSGRRIHDLTLLGIDDNHFTSSDKYVVFWPKFGSKTDCTNHRQSGWKLLHNSDCKNLDPVFWVNHTVSLLKNKRDLANINNLFVTLRGEIKAASRTIIAGWIKTVLKEAGITGTPGSIRSAVASKNWIDNFPIEDILARGNWRSENTFSRYYRREVMPVSFNSNADSVTVQQFFEVIE